MDRTPAPGADDNGTGKRRVLQIAHALRGHPNRETLRFILFGGEEQGLLGSRQYVGGLSPAERARVRAVINMDMIGCLNRRPASVLLEGSPASAGLIDDLAAMAETYTTLTVETSLAPAASDHVPFINQGIPAVLTIEGADQANSAVHSRDDTLDRVNLDLALDILRMNVAFVARAVDRVERDIP
jgi:Zn-dependent M28 family amino/carboxypeptidase